MYLTKCRWFACVALCLAVALAAPAEKSYTYVGDVGSNHVLLAWGTATGENQIGDPPAHMGKRSCASAVRSLRSQTKIMWSSGICNPTTPEYDYQVDLAGRRIGQVKIRTWPV